MPQQKHKQHPPEKGKWSKKTGADGKEALVGTFPTEEEAGAALRFLVRRLKLHPPETLNDPEKKQEYVAQHACEQEGETLRLAGEGVQARFKNLVIKTPYPHIAWDLGLSNKRPSAPGELPPSPRGWETEPKPPVPQVARELSARLKEKRDAAPDAPPAPKDKDKPAPRVTPVSARDLRSKKRSAPSQLRLPDIDDVNPPKPEGPAR